MAIKGYIYITSTGYDPERGKEIKDPYLGDTPTLGACMPNIRRRVDPGDYIFLISGKVPNVPQYIVGGFEVAENIKATVAYKRFPDLRLRQKENGQLTGNIVVDAWGNQHHLDNHNSSTFGRRVENYVVGRNPICITHPHEIELARELTLDILKSVYKKDGPAPINIVGRWSRLDAKQIEEIKDWLLLLKTAYQRKAS